MNDPGLPERLLRRITDQDELEMDHSGAGIADAALRQFELFGLARTTMEDIARRANVSRVTVYRHFSGKDAVIETVLLRELQRFLNDLHDVVEPLASPEAKIVEGLVFTLDTVRAHRLLNRLLESEPEMILPHLTIQGGAFLAAAREFLTARLAAELGESRSAQELEIVSDLVVRLVLSFLLTPQTVIDIDDPDVARRFARRYVTPIIASATTGRSEG